MKEDSSLAPDYALSSQLLSDGEPVRCVTLHDSHSRLRSSSAWELLSGSQGGVISRFVLSNHKHSANGDDVEMQIQPGGTSTKHPHHITSIVSSLTAHQTASDQELPCLYVTGCKDGIIRVMHGETHELMYTLEGHTNAVTSLSWIPPLNSSGNIFPWLLSGSWDGTAKIWDVFSSSATCLGTLTGHENTVSVAGLPAESATIRKAVTVSAGIAEGTVIRGHTVRIWRLNETSHGTHVTSQIVSSVANDHSGPIRDVCYDPASHAIYTCSNDGTVKVRSAEDGMCLTTLAYPGDQPMLLSLCVVSSGETKAVVAGAEDGNVVIWDISHSKYERNRDAQVIPHPGCVWRVSPVGDNDFVTACHDGQIRIFTRNPKMVASADVLRSFQEAVTAALSARSSGPSTSEISKLPIWERNALTKGRSEGQVQMFQKDGKAIAAQWSSLSRTWIEVGEVLGTSANAGTINGKNYDHVLPIEIDVPGGSIRNLQIGYNNGENPFVTAQEFIDRHQLNQSYLAQIADYIRQRAGETIQTLGMESGDFAENSLAAVPSASNQLGKAVISFTYLPMKGFKIFDNGIEKKGLTKIVEKVREFNGIVTSNHLSVEESGDMLNSLSTTLTMTNRYHSSTISNAELAILPKMIVHWGSSYAYPAVDLARMVVLHPDAAKRERSVYWKEILTATLTMCSELGDGITKEIAIPMLTMRLVANCYKGGAGSAQAAESQLDRILKCAGACVSSSNKNVRLAAATVILNTSSFMYESSSSSSSSALLLLDIVSSIAANGNCETEGLIRILMALGTALLIPGQCGLELKRAAKDRDITTVLDRLSNAHGAMTVAVMNEINIVLSS